MTNVLSILDPAGPEPAAFRAFGPHLRTTLRFHDAIERAPHVVLPQRAHIKAILAFGRDLGGDLSHLLIHCHAGISPSEANATRGPLDARPGAGTWSNLTVATCNVSPDQGPTPISAATEPLTAKSGLA